MEINSKQKQASVIIGAAIIIGIFTFYNLFFAGISKKNDTTYLLIDKNDNIDSIYTKFEQVTSGGNTFGLKILVSTFGYADHIRTGRYAIKKGEGSLHFFRKLRNGTQEAIDLVIPSVRTMDKLAAFLSEKLMMDSVELKQKFMDNAFCSKYGYDTATLACLFIPNTYEIYWDISLDGFMKRMQKENKIFWSSERLEKAQKAGLKPNEVITLASIVDEETANNTEKPKVAGMYVNRYKIGMPLQADPTIKYAWKEFGLKRIYNNLLSIKSPYNTYRNIGLPPGPIRIPSVAGIDAVLNHERHKYLFMCAKEDLSGTHNFAETYSDHMKNAAKYTEALNKRGIK